MLERPTTIHTRPSFDFLMVERIRDREADPALQQAYITAFTSVDRGTFVPPHLQKPNMYNPARAFQLGEIAEGLSLSAPFLLFEKFQLAGITPGMRIGDIGSGRGYSTALLSQLAEHVYGVEYDPWLAEKSEQILSELGFDNTTMFEGDGALGVPNVTDLDAVIINAACTEIPPPIIEQVKVGGKIVAPVGYDYNLQMLVVAKKLNANGDLDISFDPDRPVTYHTLDSTQRGGWTFELKQQIFQYKQDLLQQMADEFKVPVGGVVMEIARIRQINRALYDNDNQFLKAVIHEVEVPFDFVPPSL